MIPSVRGFLPQGRSLELRPDDPETLALLAEITR
jgi:hypothetical protein